MTTPVRALADEVWDHSVATSPYLRAARGLPIEHLRAESDAAWREDAAYAQGILDRLDAVEPVEEDDHLTAGFLRHVLGGQVATGENALQTFTVAPFTQYFLTMGLQSAFSAFNGSDDTYLSLVGDFRNQVIELRERLVRQREVGIIVPAPALPGIRESLSRASVSASALINGSAPESIKERAAAMVDGEVLPAFAALLEHLGEDYERSAPSTVGMCQQPGGEPYYRSLVRMHTASTMTPEEVHALGLEQIAELADKMAKLRSEMGFNGTEEEFHEQLKTDPRIHTSNPQDVEDLFLRHMANLEPLLPQWFHTKPNAPYAVKRLDEALEAGMTYGYYEPPNAADPYGYYRWNGGNLESKSLLTYATLIFHELAPGHHFHIAAQAENTALPDIRRESGDIGAFNEGWAEYAAGLGWEMGLYEDPLDAYGRLVHERFTAQRLVLDTGLNYYGWDLDKGRAYMAANTTESPGQIATEVLRYSTDLPAQALAYRAGFVELNRLRAKVEKAQGAAFDVRDFHAHVVGNGALPFPVIEAHLERWMAGNA